MPLFGKKDSTRGSKKSVSSNASSDGHSNNESATNNDCNKENKSTTTAGSCSEHFSKDNIADKYEFKDLLGTWTR